jgi:hypothetical protein
MPKRYRYRNDGLYDVETSAGFMPMATNDYMLRELGYEQDSSSRFTGSGRGGYVQKSAGGAREKAAPKPEPTRPTPNHSEGHGLSDKQRYLSREAASRQERERPWPTSDGYVQMVTRGGEPVIVNNTDIEQALSVGYTFRSNRAMMQSERPSAQGSTQYWWEEFPQTDDAERRRQIQAQLDEKARLTRLAEIAKRREQQVVEEEEEELPPGVDADDQLDMLDAEGRPVKVRRRHLATALELGFKPRPNRAMMQGDEDLAAPKPAPTPDMGGPSLESLDWLLRQ